MLTWLQGTNDRCELAFQLVPWNGFTVARAGLGLAEIVRIPLSRSLCPRTPIRLATVTTQNKPSEGKLITNVLTGWQLAGTFTQLLNLIEGLKGDERFVLGFQPIEIVGLATNVPGIERLFQNIGDTLLCNFVVFVAWEVREAFKEAFYFCLRLEPA
nr:hypothetical protein [Roseibium album]